MSVLSLQNVKKTYGVGETANDVLKGIDLDLQPGTTALVGPSGAGKSTLLAIAGLLDTPSNGTIQLEGKDVTTLSPKKRASTRLKSIGFVFQEFNLISELCSWENVALPAVGLGYSFNDYKSRAIELLDRVGCKDLAERLPSELSGGQIQRIAVARALVLHPKLILADEPTGNLDSKNAHTVIELLNDSIDDDAALLVVTHDPELAEIMHRQIHIEDGVISSNQTTSEER